jgi:hypothetical protein
LPGAWTALATALTEERFVTALRAAAARSPRAPFAVLASYLGLLADADPADGQAVGTTAQPPGPDAVIAKLVLLYVAERALSPQTRLLEQRIELVQVSADTRTFLDPSRFEATKKLNGLQLHHFASFYKCSWRANDWMWGRLDGLGWLVHILLDPKRLLALEASHEGWLSELPQRLADLAASAGAPDVTVPVESLPPKARAELDGLLARKDDPPASLPETATWAAAALQRLVLADELVAVARALDDDRKAGGAATPQASDFRTRYYSFLPATAQAGAPPDQDRTNLLAVIPPDSPAAPGAHPFDHLLTKCRISEETFKGERGSRLFTTTVTQAAAVAVSAVEAVHPVPPPMRPVAKAASWTTRTAYMAASHSTDSRGLNAAACFAVIAGGIGLMVTNQPLLSAAGFVAALAALFVLALLSRPGTPGKVVVALVVAAALAVTAALAAAVWIEPLRKPLFGWLTDGLGDFRDGRLPWVWLAIVVLLLAPPVVMVVDAVSDVRRRLAQRAAPPPPSTTTAPRTTSVATSPTTVPEPRRGADQPSVQ